MDAAYGGSEVGGCGVFEEESARSRFEGAEHVVVGFEHRRHTDACLHQFRGGADVSGGSQAVESGHANVHEDDIRAQSGGEVDGFATVGRLADDGDVVLRVQQHGEALPDQCLVVGDHDADR